MAPANAQTVFGFGSGLDWRPTCFVNPFPQSRVCSVCGLVPSSAAMLACRHLLCQSCYDGVGGKRHYCPLDKEPFQEEDVAWTTIGAGIVLSRKVRCWNAEHCCDAEDVATTMLEHFASGCQFHVVRCPRCSQRVLHRNIAVHLESCATPSCTSEQPLGENFANAFIEVKEALRKISEENRALRTKFDSLEDRPRPDTNSSLATQSTAIAGAVADVLENRISLLRNRAEAASLGYLAVKEALDKLSGENAALQMKLESLEAHLDTDSAMTKLSAIVSHSMRVVVEKTSSACRVETEAALNEGFRRVTSEIRDALATNEQTERTMKQTISQERERNVKPVCYDRRLVATNERTMKQASSQECKYSTLGRKDMLVEPVCYDRRLADGAISPVATAGRWAQPVEYRAKALAVLAMASLSARSNFLDKSLPYEWTIEDWTGFCAKSPRSVQYFTDNDGLPSYHYGYLIVPRLCFGTSKVWLHAFVIEGLFDGLLKWPMDKKIKLLFINPCDCTRQLTVQSPLSQVKSKPLPDCSKEVLFVGRSDKVAVDTFYEYGVIGNNKLRLRLELEQ